MKRSVLLCLLTSLYTTAAAACGGNRYTRLSHQGHGSGITIGAEALESFNGNLLSLMRGRIANLEIHRRPGECPEISLRGKSSIMVPTPPGIYVDGEHAADSCILEMISPRNVERMEIYPMGVTQRPGYTSTTGGLILIFLKDGGS